jgi:hypothetical protein
VRSASPAGEIGLIEGAGDRIAARIACHAAIKVNSSSRLKMRWLARALGARLDCLPSRAARLSESEGQIERGWI